MMELARQGISILKIQKHLLQLVNILVDQLNGEIKLKRDKETEFVVGLSAEEKGNNKKDRPEGYASSEN